jgi:histidine triad (HIT) family protein
MADKKEDCVFCKIATGTIGATKHYEDDNFVVFDDASPFTEGHCLVVPKNHYPTILDLPSTLGTELLSVIKKQAVRLINDKKVSGFNIIQNNFASAGQVVHHFHVHVIPRKEKDGIKFLSK